MVKKEGPCCHCGVTSSPLWRNGPPEKPVLCNACGTRWRTKGTLVNYTPTRRPKDTEAERKQPKKMPIRRIVKKEPCSDQNFWKTGDADTSNRSGFGSAVSYSGSAQSHAWKSRVPSRKKSCVGRRKLSSLEALVEDLNSIMHEEKLCSGSGVHTIPGSSEEDLIYHSKTAAGSFEIGNGSMLLRHPNSESEANSVPADSKSYVTSESYSGPASFTLHSGSNGTSNSNAASEKLMWSPMRVHESARRDKLDYSKQRILENVDSALVSVALEDNYSKEVGGRGNAGGAFRGLSKSSMRPLKRPPQSFTDAEVRGVTMRIASSRPGAMASCQFRRSSFLPKPDNPTRGAGAAVNLSMVAPLNKYSVQDSLLLEVPRNVRHPEAELLLCCPPPSQLSSVTLTAASPSSYQSQLR